MGLLTLFFRSFIQTFFFLFLFCAFGCIRTEDSSKGSAIIIGGSDTMVDLARRWAFLYSQNNAVRIQITGGGSGVGIISLIAENIDLANASRKMGADEYKRIKAKKDKVFSWIVGQDVLTLYVNKKNPLESLTISQIRDIYTGKIKTWNELGWKSSTVRKIISYGREITSGTHLVFHKKVMKNEDFSPFVLRLPGIGMIFRLISKDVAGIGYSGMGKHKNVKPLGLRDEETGEIFFPTHKNIMSKKYPLSRNLFIYTTEKILERKSSIKKYLQWILTAEGQKEVLKEGYFPIRY